MRYLTALAVLALVAAPACGGGGGESPAAPPLPPVLKVRVERKTFQGTQSGEAEQTGPDAWTVWITASITNPDVLDHVVAHELGHVAGLPHITGGQRECIMDGDVLWTGLNEPCQEEALRLAAFGANQSIEIVSCAFDLVDATVAAINLWRTPSAFLSFNGSQGE